jgi:hypothetical protein
LYFFPLPQWQGAFRPIFAMSAFYHGSHDLLKAMYQQLRKLWSKSFVDLRCHHFGLSDADMDRIEKEG